MGAPSGKRTYSVTLCAPSMVSIHFEVKADDPVEARALAQDLARKSKDYDWMVESIDLERLNAQRIKDIT